MTPQRVTEKKKIDTAKNVRAVKAMLKQVEWLGWDVVWEADGFVYKKGKERVKPQGLIVSETQRRINKVERFPLAAHQVLGDVHEWKQQMERPLNRAKYFASLGVPDFENLKRIGKANPKVQEKQFLELLNLLEAESICKNNLPVSPGRLLADINRTNASSSRCEALDRYICSSDNSAVARALAALALGTASDAQAPELRKGETREFKAWINRCFQWGQGATHSQVGKRQFALEPVLLALLLETETGSKNTKKIVELKEELVYFHLPLAEFRLLLQSGISSDTILEVTQQFEVFERIASQILSYRNLIAESKDIRTRKKLSQKLEWERSSALDKLRSAIVKIVRVHGCEAPVTVTISKLLVVIEDLLSRYSVSRKLVNEIVTIAQNTSNITSVLRSDFLDILHTHHDLIWVGDKPASGAHSVDTTPPENSAADQPAVEGDAPVTATMATNPPEIASKSTYYGGTLTQIFEALGRTKHPGLVRRGLLSDTLAMLCMSNLKEPAKAEKFIEWCERIKLGDYHLIWTLINVMNTLPQFGEIEPLIDGFVRSLEQAPEESRGKYYQVIDDFSLKKREIKTDLQTAAEFLPRLIEITNANESCRCTCYVLMRTALNFGRKLPRLAPRLREWLADFYSQRGPMEHSQSEALERGCNFGIILIGAMQEGPTWHAHSDEQSGAINFTEIMEEVASTFMLHNIEIYSQAIVDGLVALEENALLTRLTLDKFKTQPHRCIKLFGNLGATKKLSGTAKEPFKTVAGYRAKERALAALARNGYVKVRGSAATTKCEGASKDVRLEMFDRHVVKRLCTKGWSEIVERSPHLVPEITSYICSRSITRQTQEPPQAVRKVLSMKENLVKEKAHLESKLKGPDDASGSEQSIRARLKNLEERLNDDAGIEQQMKRLLDKQVYHLSVDAEMCALEHVVNEAIRNHLKAIMGAQTKDFVVDSFLLNALLLTQDVQMNKRLLRKLIKAHVEGDKDWRHRIPANKQFLDKLKERGTEPDIWLGSHLRTFKLDGIKGGMVTIHLEMDSLKILEMGNYFDTCLSFGGENSFSTVTNAVDLNKRVVYAFDKQGTAVGRKLIGLNEDGNLIGYRTYTSIENQEIDDALSYLINDYVKAFAKMCNLTLSSIGTVPSLATKFWYDDGVEPWLESDEKSKDQDEGETETVVAADGEVKSKGKEKLQAKGKKESQAKEKKKLQANGRTANARRRVIRNGCELREKSTGSLALKSHAQV